MTRSPPSARSHSNPSAPMTPQPRLGDYLSLLFLGAVWGGNFLLIKIGVETVPPATLAVIRLFVAALVTGAIAVMLRESFRFPHATWGPILLASFSGNALPFILIGWGQARIDAGLAAICMAVMPLSTILLAHAFTHDEKLSWRKGLGIAFGFLGLVVLIGPDRLAGFGREALGELAMCAGALCYGVNALVTRHLRGQPLTALASVTLGISALMDLPIALAFEAPWAIEPSSRSLIAIAVLAALPTGLGTLQMFGIIKRLGASFFSQINFIVPIAGVFWGAVFFGERLSLAALGALMLILIGIAVTRERTRP